MNPFEATLKMPNWKDPKVSGAALAALILIVSLFSWLEKKDPPPEVSATTTTNTTVTAPSTPEEKVFSSVPSDSLQPQVEANVESPRPPLCPVDSCPHSDFPHVFVITAEDRALLRKDQVLSLKRTTPKRCLRIGDKVTLARFDKTQRLAFWMGEAQLIAAIPINPQSIQLQLILTAVSPTESELLAPICQLPCRAVTDLQGLRNQRPFVISVGEQTRDSLVSKEDFLSLTSVQPQNIASLKSAALPTDLKRPIVLQLAMPTVAWRPALEWLYEEAKKSGRPIYWLYPSDIVKETMPPSVIGVTEVDTSWLQELEHQRAHATSATFDLQKIRWAGEKVANLPSQALPSNRPESFRELDMIGPWEDSWPKIKSLYTKIDRKSRIVVMSRSYADYESYYLARILAAERLENIYWYRSSIQNWQLPLNFDPLPVEFQSESSR